MIRKRTLTTEESKAPGGIILNPPTNVEQRIKRAATQNIDSIWHLVITHVMNYPDKCTDTDLWGEFRGILPPECSFQAFRAACANRHLPDLRKASQNKQKQNKKDLKASDSVSLTQQAVVSLKEKRRRAAIMHVDRMDVIIDKATSVLEGESEFIAKQPAQIARNFLPDHLNNANSLHKLAKSVYDMDNQSDENNAKMQLQVLMSFNPHAAPNQGSTGQGTNGASEEEPIDI